MNSALRLLAQDAEDLKIVSAHLQDAVMRVGDLAYLPKAHRFAILLNRYSWEEGPEEGTGSRVRAGLHFDGVLGVKAHNIRRDDPEAVASLLAIDFTPGSDGGGSVDLLFCGGGRIRLEVECIDATLSDIAEPRPAAARPKHDLERS